MSVISSCVVLSVQIKVGFMNIVKGYHHTVALHVMMEFKLGQPGGPTLSLPAARSYVGIINSRVLTTSRPDLSTAVPTLQIINYFYGSTFFLADFSNFIFGNESARSSAVFFLTLYFRIRFEEAKLVLIISDTGIWSPIKAVIYNVAAGRESEPVKSKQAHLQWHH